MNPYEYNIQNSSDYWAQVIRDELKRIADALEEANKIAGRNQVTTSKMVDNRF